MNCGSNLKKNATDESGRDVATSYIGYVLQTFLESVLKTGLS